MCFISKSPCCDTSVPGVRDPIAFLPLRRFDEVDRGWDGCVESAGRSIFCTHSNAELLRSSDQEVFGEQDLVLPLGSGGDCLCSPGFPHPCTHPCGVWRADTTCVAKNAL